MGNGFAQNGGRRLGHNNIAIQRVGRERTELAW